MKIIAIIIFLYLLNIGSYYYLHKVYVKALRRCRKYGTVSTGRSKGYLRGSIVLLSFRKEDGKIIYAELLEGSTIFCKFKRFDEIIDMNIEEAEERYGNLKNRKCVIQALSFIKEELENSNTKNHDTHLVIDC